MHALTPEECPAAPFSAQSARGRVRGGNVGPVTEPATVSECHEALVRIHVRLAELTRKPEPAADEELTRPQAAELVGEPSSDRLFRRGMWEPARVRTYQKAPLYSRAKLLAIKAEQERRSSIRNLHLVV